MSVIQETRHHLYFIFWQEFVVCNQVLLNKICKQHILCFKTCSWCHRLYEDWKCCQEFCKRSCCPRPGYKVLTRTPICLKISLFAPKMYYVIKIVSCFKIEIVSYFLRWYPCSPSTCWSSATASIRGKRHIIMKIKLN